jgi:Zn-dependent protease with chaperone function
MDFFARQAATRRQSRWMVFLFILAVIAIVVAIDLVVVTTVAVLAVQDEGGLLASPDMTLSRYPLVVLFTTIVVLGTIGISSLVRTVSLAAGGGKVAEQLGGARVGADTTDPLKQRLRNVVEEMAIASGVPVPQVYVLEREAGINAFAAGYSPANAAIAVTRGALVNLNRDELQGVIAHEFSHVLNGDMRLSTRLIGLLFGLTVIAMIARTILRLAPRGSGSGRKGGGGVAVIFVAALVVLALGWIGLFFGRLIQAAVSRHRESLADASAVQFTRDPQGLRNALVKIGALGAGSRFVDADAEEVAHLLFAEGIGRAFATHPPLVERIREIDPRFQPSEFDEVRRRMGDARAMAEEEAAQGAQPAARRGGAFAGAIALAPAAVAGLVANPGTEHVLKAQAMLDSLPESFRRAARQPGQATALFVALAIDTAPETRERQLAFIHQQYSGEHYDAVKAMLPQVDALTAVQRMPALLQVFAALSQLGRAERVELLKCLNGLLVRENRASPFAYALRKLAQVQLQDNLDPRRRAAGHLRAAGARDSLQVLFSALATQGSEGEAAARQAYEAGMDLMLPGIHPPYARLAHWPPQLDQALTRIDRLQPEAKGLLVQALAATISHDARMTVAESELLRAICATVHCPLPPLYIQGDVHLGHDGR